MRVEEIGVQESLLEERRSRGADRWDEMWDGVLHMVLVPVPSGPHQRFLSQLALALSLLARAHGLVGSHTTELYRPGVGRDDYRTPDLAFYQPRYATDRGVEGRAELAVEIRSPNDETYDKLPFYAEMEVQELLVVEPHTCEVELFVLIGGRLERGELRSHALGVSFETVDGPALRITWDGGSADVHGRV
jgi:Uma2 family endonuclease